MSHFSIQGNYWLTLRWVRLASSLWPRLDYHMQTTTKLSDHTLGTCKRTTSKDSMTKTTFENLMIFSPYGPPPFQRNRSWEVFLAQLYLGYTWLAHEYYMPCWPRSMRSHCDTQLTNQHTLNECLRFTSSRTICFPSWLLLHLFLIHY